MAKKQCYYLTIFLLKILNSGNQDMFELNNLENSFYCRRKPISGDISPRKEQLVEDAEKVPYSFRNSLN